MSGVTIPVLTLLLTALLIVPTEQRIYNILRCNIRENLIHECDGTLTPITPEHERILNNYMDKLAAYYRVLYSGSTSSLTNNNRINADPNLALKEPEYPQFCKRCEDKEDAY